jgi:hypothetical protein
LFSCPTLCGLFSFIVPTKIGISYYIKNRLRLFSSPSPQS